MSYPEEKICLVIVEGFASPIARVPNTKKTAYLNEILQKSVYCELQAAGEYVGCDQSIRGNSEMGYITLGAGRTCLSNVKMVDKVIESGELVERLRELFYRFTKRIHLVGLLSDNYIYSDVKHCMLLNEILRKELKDSDVYIHAIADGKDVDPCSFKQYYSRFDNIVSVTGRYYAFDNNTDYTRIEKTYDMMVGGKKSKLYLTRNYKNGITDEFIKPTLLHNQTIHPDDTIIFFNADGSLSYNLAEKFQQTHRNLFTLTTYKRELGIPILTSQRILNTLPEILAKQYYSQAHIGESERFKNITYCFNGMSYHVNYGEQDILVGNPDKKKNEPIPDCDVLDIAYQTAEIIKRNIGFVTVCLAGPEYIGYSENYLATEKSVENFDKQIKIIYDACRMNKSLMIITSNYGNCYRLTQKNSSFKNKNIKSTVPFILVSDEYELNDELVDVDTSLKDVAPTILWLYHLNTPREMNGGVLVKKKK